MVTTFRWLVAVCLCLWAWGYLPSDRTVAVAAADEVDLFGVREEHVMVPMRDGTRLSAYLYFPPGHGRWPVLYEQRYAALQGAGTRQSYARLALGGFVVCAQNFRGAGQSEGTWVGYRALGWGEQQDGFDTVEWLAAQPWSTGRVGTFGSSQAGFAQNFLAVTQPPHLVAQYMIDTGLSLFHEGYRIGGTTRPERFKGMDAVCRVPEHNRELLDEWFRHPTYDAYWKQEDCSRHFPKMNVPCFTIGSWFDFMNIGSIESYRGRQHRGGDRSRGQQQLIIGPWLHGGYQGKNSNVVSELTFPENAKFDAESHMLRWFDYWLNGGDCQVDRDPTVRYYVMGAVGEVGAPGNVWRETNDWPVDNTPTAYYLQKDRSLSQVPPTDADDVVSYMADPVHPVLISNKKGFPGAADARSVEDQAEVRTFTSEPLTHPVEWTGLIKAELFVTCSTQDSDFIVRVSDVYPDGRSILLVDYVRRGRYRKGYEQEVFFTPEQVERVAFDVGWISQVFSAGHRIRVTVCSTGAPFYETNPNTGEPLTLEFPARTEVATIGVQVNAKHASRVIAPVRE